MSEFFPIVVLMHGDPLSSDLYWRGRDRESRGSLASVDDWLGWRVGEWSSWRDEVTIYRKLLNVAKCKHDNVYMCLNY